MNYKDYIGPSKEQIKDIVMWDNLSEDQTILVHCTAGKSRSTAVSLGILIRFGYSLSDALEEVIKIRTNEGNSLIVPNRLIIKHLDEIFDLGGELIKLIDDYYETLEKTVPLQLLRIGRHTIED